MPWHISIGMLLLVLVVLRMVWAARQRGNRPEQDPGNAFLVNVGHFLLYAGMMLLPITGILTMVGNGYDLTAFGVELVGKGGEIPWLAAAGSLHCPVAWGLLVLIVGHIGIALRHHFVKKEATLQRML